MAIARPLVISIDTEAQPTRASGEHVQRLIHGNFANHSGGIGKMMDLAEKHNIVLTFFLDYAECDLYGEQIIETGKLIEARGHDLQLHFHPEFLSLDTLKKHDCERQKLDELDYKHASAYVDIMLERHQSASSASPVAFRGGGYRYSAMLLKVLAKHGITVCSNHNPAKSDRGFAINRLSQFKWQDTEQIELPVGCLDGFRNLDRKVAYNFNSGVFLRDKYSSQEVVKRHSEYRSTYYQRESDSAACCMVMHSWSLLTQNAQGKFSGINHKSIAAFDAVLEEASQSCSVIPISAIHQYCSNLNNISVEPLPFTEVTK